MHSKRSLEQVSFEGFAKQGNDKRQRVDQHRVKYLNLQSERREIEPSLFSGLSASAPAIGKSTELSYDKKAVNPTMGRNRGNVVMQPPKVVKNAIMEITGTNGISTPVYFNNQNSRNSLSETHEDSRPPKNLNNAEHGLLLEIIRKGDELGFQDDEGKSESAEKYKNVIAGFGSANNIKATQFGKVRNVLDLFKETLVKLQREQQKVKAKGGMKIYIDAAMQLKKRHQRVNVSKSLGAVPGVEFGDCFQSRAELVIIGLHGQFVAGIDYMNINGKLLATSIIATDRYGDKNTSSDVLTYMGEGGNPVSNSDKPEDQKLVRGNLALKNSKDEEAPVRVIRSYQNIMKKSQLIYDGLYIVSDCWKEAEPCGRLVYKFKLNKMQGQQTLIRWDTMNASQKSKKASVGPIVVNDISEGKEKTQIRVVNAVDCEKHPPFKYITKMIYQPQRCVISKPSLCTCLNGCAEDTPCSCFIKKSYEVPVNNSVLIAGKKPIVYECGPSCKCPPDCKNRISQHGIKLQLEVFRTSPKGWGVRSRNFITEGRFISFDNRNSYGTEASLSPTLQSGSTSKDGDDTKVVKFGNVGRFIRHSCSSNLYAKLVLFDHEDKSRPHVMLFAAKNIAPRTELTFDYQLW
ncbi:hypothetical protein AgCh_012959 [Apium graveolens]